MESYLFHELVVINSTLEEYTTTNQVLKRKIYEALVNKYPEKCKDTADVHKYLIQTLQGKNLYFVPKYVRGFELTQGPHFYYK